MKGATRGLELIFWLLEQRLVTLTGPGGTGAAVDLQGYEEWTLSDDGLILYSQGHMDEEEYERQLAAGPAVQD